MASYALEYLASVDITGVEPGAKARRAVCPGDGYVYVLIRSGSVYNRCWIVVCSEVTGAVVAANVLEVNDNAFSSVIATDGQYIYLYCSFFGMRIINLYAQGCQLLFSGVIGAPVSASAYMHANAGHIILTNIGSGSGYARGVHECFFNGVSCSTWNTRFDHFGWASSALDSNGEYYVNYISSSEFYVFRTSNLSAVVASANPTNLGTTQRILAFADGHLFTCTGQNSGTNSYLYHYYFDGSSLTQIGSYYQLPAGLRNSPIYQVIFDGSYVYLWMGGARVASFKVNPGGSFTYISVVDVSTSEPDLYSQGDWNKNYLYFPIDGLLKVVRNTVSVTISRTPAIGTAPQTVTLSVS